MTKITIYSMTKKEYRELVNDQELWDYPQSELDYLMEKLFDDPYESIDRFALLEDGRLYEIPNDLEM